MTMHSLSLYKPTKYRCLQQITYPKSVLKHILYRNVWCVWNPSSIMYYLPISRFRLALLVFLFSPFPQEHRSQKTIFVMEMHSPMMQKVNKRMFSSSIVSVTSALIGALVISGLIILTQFFCSCPCLLLLGIFSALVSGTFYIMSLTYPILQPLHQMTGIYRISTEMIESISTEYLQNLLDTEEEYKIKVSAIT